MAIALFVVCGCLWVRLLRHPLFLSSPSLTLDHLIQIRPTYSYNVVLKRIMIVLKRILVIAQHSHVSRRIRKVFLAKNCKFSSPSVQVDRHVHNHDKERRNLPDDGLTLGDFVQNNRESSSTLPLSSDEKISNSLSFHIKTFGCQMNVNDSVSCSF